MVLKQSCICAASLYFSNRGAPLNAAWYALAKGADQVENIR